MNPCLPHPVGASSSLTYTLSGLTEEQIASGLSVSIHNATIAVDNTTVNGAVITDATSGSPVTGVTLTATGTLTF